MSLLRRRAFSPVSRLLTISVALVTLLTFGVVGYMTIEGWSFFDALHGHA